MKTKFRNETNQLILHGLFLESRSRLGDHNAIYTLGREDKTLPEDGRHFPSIYKLYMASEDLTEVEFANKYFESYEHWLRLLETPSVAKEVTKWRKELRAKLKGRALEAIEAIAMDPDNKVSDRLNALKYLIDKELNTQPTKPSAKEQKQDTDEGFKAETIDYDDIAKDFQRLLDDHTPSGQDKPN